MHTQRPLACCRQVPRSLGGKICQRRPRVLNRSGLGRVFRRLVDTRIGRIPQPSHRSTQYSRYRSQRIGYRTSAAAESRAPIRRACHHTSGTRTTFGCAVAATAIRRTRAVSRAGGTDRSTTSFAAESGRRFTATRSRRPASARRRRRPASRLHDNRCTAIGRSSPCVPGYGKPGRPSRRRLHRGRERIGLKF